jgi:hypothetical protein
MSPCTYQHDPCLAPHISQSLERSPLPISTLTSCFVFNTESPTLGTTISANAIFEFAKVVELQLCQRNVRLCAKRLPAYLRVATARASSSSLLIRALPSRFSAPKPHRQQNLPRIVYIASLPGRAGLYTFPLPSHPTPLRRTECGSRAHVCA